MEGSSTYSTQSLSYKTEGQGSVNTLRGRKSASNESLLHSNMKCLHSWWDGLLRAWFFMTETKGREGGREGGREEARNKLKHVMYDIMSPHMTSLIQSVVL